MLIPIRWFREYVAFDLDVPQLGERLTMAGLEVEEIHETEGDTVLDIYVTPNRGDCHSHQRKAVAPVRSHVDVQDRIALGLVDLLHLQARHRETLPELRHIQVKGDVLSKPADRNQHGQVFRCSGWLTDTSYEGGCRAGRPAGRVQQGCKSLPH